MRSLILAAAVVALAAAPATAADTYDLRGPAPTKGTVLETKQTFKLKDADATIKIMGMPIEIKQTTTSNSTERVKVLEVDGRTVTKAEKRVVKDLNETVVVVMGNDNTQSKTGELEGTVIVSKRGGEGKWTNSLVDAEPTDKQKKKLDKLRGPESDDNQYPAEKVAVGHAWTVDAKEMAKQFGDDIKDLTGKVEQKFLRVEKLDDEECAVIESKAKITGKSEADEDEASGVLDVTLDFRVVTYRSLKTGVDLKSTGTGTMKMSGAIKVMDNDAEMSVEGPIEIESSTTVVGAAK